MRKIWTWVAIILVSMCIVTLVVGVRSERAAYHAARGVVVLHAHGAQQPSDLLLRRAPGQ